jgi:hypothetical protein
MEAGHGPLFQSPAIRAPLRRLRASRTGPASDDYSAKTSDFKPTWSSTKFESRLLKISLEPMRLAVCLAASSSPAAYWSKAARNAASTLTSVFSGPSRFPADAPSAKRMRDNPRSTAKDKALLRRDEGIIDNIDAPRKNVGDDAARRPVAVLTPIVASAY